MAETPQSCESHQSDYKAKAWEIYSLEKLGSIVDFFVMRAAHRTNLVKREKDLTDAQNYLNMMQSKLTEEKEAFLVLKRKDNAEQRRLKAINTHLDQVFQPDAEKPKFIEPPTEGSGPGW